MNKKIRLSTVRERLLFNAKCVIFRLLRKKLHFDEMSTILEEHTELGVYRRTQLGVYRRIKSCVFIEDHTELSVYRRTVRCL